LNLATFGVFFSVILTTKSDFLGITGQFFNLTNLGKKKGSMFEHVTRIPKFNFLSDM